MGIFDFIKNIFASKCEEELSVNNETYINIDVFANGDCKTGITFDELRHLLLYSQCKRLKETYNNAFLNSFYEKPREYYYIDSDILQEAKKCLAAWEEEERKLSQTAHLNNLGIQYEKDGNIEKAIEVYEECAKIGYKASHCYKRLQIIYKKKKDYDSVNRIRAREAEVYGTIFTPFVPASSRKRPETIIYPSKAYKLQADKYTWEYRYINLIKSLPEFEFYTKVSYGDWDIFPFEKAEKLRELREEKDTLLEEAHKLEKDGDLDKAAKIYAKLIANRVYDTKPYERLYMIYKRAKLKDESIIVLKEAIAFFTELRAKQWDYILYLSDKYKVKSIKGIPLADYGKISYYGGAFELYNPRPIIEKWQCELTKHKK